MHQYKGKIILHTGSMFSGKTSSLWRELKRFEIAKYKIKVFKPTIDNRYSNTDIVTHDNNSIEAENIESIDDVIKYINENENKIDLIGIDELQFLKDSGQYFAKKILELSRNNNITIVLAGLDMDFEANPFEIVKEIMAISDYLYKHHAVCVKCGSDAWISHKKKKEKNKEFKRIEIGSSDLYEPLCRKCYFKRKA